MKKALKNGLAPERFWAKDIDGNLLKTYRVGKFLVTENLKVEHYNDGMPIPVLEDGDAWTKDTAGAMCYYSNYKANAKKYGALYNFHAVNTGKLAPEGWRVTTDEDWKQIEIALGMSKEDADKGECWRGNGVGDRMRKVLEVVFAGNRSLSGGGFYYLGTEADWWCSSVSGTGAWYRELYSSYTSVSRLVLPRSYGFSVRCVRELSDSEIDSFDDLTISGDVDLKSIETEQLISELRKRGYKGEVIREERIKI